MVKIPIAFYPPELKYFVQHDAEQNEEGIIIVHAQADQIKPILHPEILIPQKSSLRGLVLCKRLHLPEFMETSVVLQQLSQKLKQGQDFTLQDITLLEEESKRQASAQNNGIPHRL